MKIAKRDIAILMVIIGLIAGFCSYKFYFSSSMDSVTAEEKKQTTLQSQIDEINKQVDDESRMRSQMGDWDLEVTSELALYDTYYAYEDGILYMKEIEEAELATITTYTVGETALASTVSGQGRFAGITINEFTTTYSFNYTVKDYETLKKLIDYVVDRGNGIRSLTSMSFSVDNESGSISGSIALNIYTMTDGTTSYTTPYIEGVDLSVDNIFGLDSITSAE